MEIYNYYGINDLLTEDAWKLLDYSKNCALKAAYADLKYKQPFDLLYLIGIAYLNLKNNDAAEKLARCAIYLKPDSPLAWFSWGASLRQIKFNTEAIECFDRAKELSKFDKQYDILSEIYFIRANTLRRLKLYDDAIDDFLNYFERKKNNGYAWGYYGLTLEAKAKSLKRIYVFKWDEISEDNREKILNNFSKDLININDKKTKAILESDDDKIEEFIEKMKLIEGKECEKQDYTNERDYLLSVAERAYQKSLKCQKDFFPVYAALARIHRRHARKHIDKLEVEKLYQQAIDEYKCAKKYSFPLFKKILRLPIHSLCAPKDKDQLKAKLLCQRAVDECYYAKKYMISDLNKTNYNRACVEVNCKNEEKAHALLEIAIKQVNPEWLEEDPDWEEIKLEDWFKRLVIRCKADKQQDIMDLILKTTLRKKLDNETGKRPYFINEYDIKDPIRLAWKIIDPDGNRVLCYIKRKFSEDNINTLDAILTKIKKYNIEANKGDEYNVHNFIKENLKNKECVNNILIEEFNKLLEDKDLLYILDRFAEINLECVFIDINNEEDYLYSNRKILESIFKNELDECHYRIKTNDSIYLKPHLAQARFYALKNEIQPSMLLIQNAFKDNKLSLCDLLDPAFESLSNNEEFINCLKQLLDKKNDSYL